MPSSAGQTCARSEEHTSELQSHSHLVCRLLLEKKIKVADRITKTIPRIVSTLPHRFQFSRSRTTSQPGQSFGSWLWHHHSHFLFVFFLNEPAPPKIYPFPLHAALRF